MSAFTMNKIIIIGSPGSGKSTFARALQRLTKLPLIHLDRLYWNPDRSIVDKPMFLANLQAVLAQKAWIIDGNYASTMEQRLQACDTVFFLDYPTEVCLAGLDARRGQARPDMPWIELSDEQDPDFIEFVQNYRQEQRPQVLDLLAQYKDKQVYVFESREQAQQYLDREALN